MQLTRARDVGSRHLIPVRLMSVRIEKNNSTTVVSDCIANDGVFVSPYSLLVRSDVTRAMCVVRLGGSAWSNS